MVSAGELRARSVHANRLLRDCRLCPRSCGVDRTRGERGFCGAGIKPRVAASSVHFGEEPPLSGSRGSGNIFFSFCNLACLYCQNYPVSRLGVGRDMTTADLADIMLCFQERAVHNVNFVSPTPWVPQILEALTIARAQGFSLPLVYNSGGYDRPETLALLEGVVDLYLPDMKYARPGTAWRYSRAPRYVEANRRAIDEMVRQVGPLVTDDGGVARRGVLVRHLVLPDGGEESERVLGSLAALFPGVPLSLMFQYFPAYRAVGHPVLGRRLWREECAATAQVLEHLSDSSGWFQEYD